MEGASTLVSGIINMTLVSTPFRRPIWEAIEPEIGRTSSICKFDAHGFGKISKEGLKVHLYGQWRVYITWGACRLRIRRHRRTQAGATHNDLAYLRKIDSDNDFQILQNHFPAKYDHVNIHQARLEHEFKGAAWLRAEAYSEQQAYTRYVDSFRKKFAEQEFTALKRRVSGQPGSYVCLVAVSKALPKDAVDLTWQDGENETGVLGTLDVSLHHPSPGEAFGGQGLPYGYIANVCVDKTARKQGIASTLMECALQVGRVWGLNAIYVHAHASNEAAFKLYVKKGFEVLEAGCSPQLVDNNVLLRLQLQ